MKQEIEELRKSEEMLKAALARAEEANKVRTTFLSNISSEFKRTLSEINDFADFLKVVDHTKEEKVTYLQNIENNSNKILALINDIIDLSKIESNELVLNKTNFSLNVLLLEIFNHFDNFKSKLRKDHIDLIVKKPNTPLPVMVINDKDRLEQVLSNMVLNALKYTYDGTVEFGYEFINEKEAELVRFYVKDTGVGIPPHLQNIIFDRFRQMDSTYTKDFGGSGLGLTVCKHLIKLMGGDLWVESQVGGGATFLFTIPYVTQNTETPKK